MYPLGLARTCGNTLLSLGATLY